jgi:chromosome segregation ATPase
LRDRARDEYGVAARRHFLASLSTRVHPGSYHRNLLLSHHLQARDAALSAQQKANEATQKAVCELEEVRASAHAAAEEALRQEMNAVRTESTEAQQLRQEAEEQAITMEMKLQRTETKLSELASELERFRGVEKALDAPAGGESDEEDAMRGGAKARLFADVLTTLSCEEPQQAVAAITSLQEELRAAKEHSLALDKELKALQQTCTEAESSAAAATQALEAWEQERTTLQTTLADVQKELEAVRTQHSDDVTALTTEIESLRVEICQLTENRNATEEVKAAAEKRTEEATAALEALKAEFDAATANVEALQEAAVRASDELKRTQEELHATEETLHATTATLEATESALEAHQQIALQQEEKRACGVEAGMQCEPLSVAEASAQVEMDVESNSAKRDHAAMELAEALSRVRELEEALSLAGGLRQAEQPLPGLVQADGEAEAEAEPEAEAEAESEAGGQSPPHKKGNFATRTLHALKAKSPFVKRKRRLKPKVGRMSVGNEELTEFGMARVQSLETPAKDMLPPSAGPGAEAIPMATIADVESDSDDDEVSFGTSGPKANTTSAGASAATMAELRGKLAALEAQVVASDQARAAAETAAEQESARVRVAEAELNIVIDKLAASVGEHRQLEETAATHATEREALEERLVSSASMLERLQENLNEARQERKATLERASELEAQLTSMKHEHVQGASETSTRVAELEQRVAELEIQVAELDAARAMLQEQAQQSACAEAEAQAELVSARAEVEQLETTQGEMIQDLDNAQHAREAAEAKALETEAASATQLAELTQLAAAMEAANARVAEAEASGTTLSAALSTAQEEAMVAAQAAEAAETRVTQLEAELTALKSQLQASQASLAAKDAEVPANAERQQVLEEEVARLSQSLADVQAKLQQADSELVTLGLEREALATRNSELEQGTATAHASLSEAEGVKTRLESQLEQMRGELMSQTDELVASEQRCMAMEKEVEGQKRQLKEEKAKASKAKKRIATLEENIKGDDDYQEQQLALLRRDYEAKTEEIRAAQARTERQAEEAAKAKAALLKAEVRIEQLTTEMMAAKAVAESVVSTARVSELEQDLNKARARIGSLSADLETAQAHAEQLQDKLDDMKRERGEAALNAPGIVGMDANYSLKEENRRLKEAHAAQAREIERLEASVDRLTAALSAARASLAQHDTTELPTAAAAAPDVVPGDNVETKQVLSAKRRPLSDANATDPRSPAQGPQSKRSNISLMVEPQTPSGELYRKAQEVAKQRGLPAVVAATDPGAAAAKAVGSVGAQAPAPSQASVGSGKPEDGPNDCETQVQ